MLRYLHRQHSDDGCNGNLSLAYDTDKFSHTLMNVLADANMSAISCIDVVVVEVVTTADVVLPALRMVVIDRTAL